MVSKPDNDNDAEMAPVPRVQLLGVGPHLIAINGCDHGIVFQVGELGRTPATITLAAKEKRNIAGEIPENIFADENKQR